MLEVARPKCLSSTVPHSQGHGMYPALGAYVKKSNRSMRLVIVPYLMERKSMIVRARKKGAHNERAEVRLFVCKHILI